MSEAHNIETTTHGRYLVQQGASHHVLLGFHGYAENAEVNLEELKKISGDWTVVAVQALNRFYNNRTQEVIASWMTRQDREVAIADNINYVRSVIDTFRPFDKLALLGFSQGASMAFRAAANV